MRILQGSANAAADLFIGGETLVELDCSSACACTSLGLVVNISQKRQNIFSLGSVRPLPSMKVLIFVKQCKSNNREED